MIPMTGPVSFSMIADAVFTGTDSPLSITNKRVKSLAGFDPWDITGLDMKNWRIRLLRGMSGFLIQAGQNVTGSLTTTGYVRAGDPSGLPAIGQIQTPGTISIGGLTFTVSKMVTQRETILGTTFWTAAITISGVGNNSSYIEIASAVDTLTPDATKTFGLISGFNWSGGVGTWNLLTAQSNTAMMVNGRQYVCMARKASYNILP